MPDSGLGLHIHMCMGGETKGHTVESSPGTCRINAFIDSPQLELQRGAFWAAAGLCVVHEFSAQLSPAHISCALSSIEINNAPGMSNLCGWLCRSSVAIPKQAIKYAQAFARLLYARVHKQTTTKQSTVYIWLCIYSW